MARPYKTRRFFKQTEIDKLRQLAAEGKSQAFAAVALSRDPGTIAGAAIRYGIQFAASKGGTPVRADIEQSRQKRAENCRRYRRRKKGIILDNIKRFDDPRCMISLDTIL